MVIKTKKLWTLGSSISAMITEVTGSCSNFQFCWIILIEFGAGFGLLMNPDPTQIQILDDQKLQHFSLKKTNYCYHILQFLRPSRRTSMLNEKPPVLQREHPALQCNSFTFFLFNGYSCAFLDPVDPDLQTQLNLDTVRILVRNTANFHVFANSSSNVQETKRKQHFVRLIEKRYAPKLRDTAPLSRFYVK